MKLDKKTMLKLMKEEFDKRLRHYLGEIETKDSKRDVDIISNAQGLKVKNEQGLELSIDNVVVVNNQEYVVLRKPEDARKGSSKEDSLFSSTMVKEFEGELTKEVIREFSAKSHAKMQEFLLQWKFRDDPLCLNDMLNIRLRASHLKDFREVEDWHPSSILQHQFCLDNQQF